MAAKGDAVVVLGTDDKWLVRGLGASQRRIQGWGQKVANDLNKTLKSNMLQFAAGFGGVALVADQTRAIIAFEDKLNQLGVSARLNQYQLGVLREQFRATAIATGISAESVLDGVTAYVTLTGDVDTATKSFHLFAKTAQATSTPIEEIAKTAAALRMNLGVTADEMEAALSGIHTQGKEGAVEFKEMSKIVSNLAPRFAMFNKTGAEGLAEMNGILQAMRVGFGTTAEAATSLEAVMGALTDAGTIKRLGEIGIRPYTTDKSGVRHMKNLSKILFEVMEKTKGDPITISKIFGRKEAVAGITKLYQQGRGEIERLIDAAGEGGEIARDFGIRLESPAVKLAQAKEKLNKVFSDALVKHLDKIVAGFEKLVAAVDWLSKNLGTVLAVIAAVKVGGYATSLAGVAGGGGGAGGLAGALGGPLGAAYGGGSRGGRAARLLAGGGALLSGVGRGAAAHYAGRALGVGQGYEALDGFAGAVGGMADELLTVSAALSAVPGPVGMVAGAIAGGVGVIDGTFKALEASVDAAQQSILDDLYGRHGGGRASDAGRARAALGVQGTVLGDLLARAGVSLKTEGREEGLERDQKYLLRQAREAGVLRDDVRGGRHVFSVDKAALATFLKKESIPEAEREAIIRETIAAVETANQAGGGVGNFARSLFGLKPIEVRISVEDGNITADVKNDRGARRGGN